jgi:hypothetical protein
MLVKLEGTNLQEKYLSEWVDTFRDPTTVGTPDKLEALLRFAHRDASHNRWDAATQTKYDEFTLEILSSKEDPTVYCDELSALTLETDPSGATFDYTIAAGDVAQAEFDFNVVLDEAKYAALKPICRDVLYYTLDFQKGDGKWTTQYSTKWDDTERESRVIMAELDRDLGKIKAAFSQHQFMNTIQKDAQSMDQTVTITGRGTARNGRGEVVLSSTFTLAVTGDGSGAACQAATITKRDGSRGTTIAVPDVIDGAVVITEFSLMQTINVVGNTADCNPVFILLMKDTLDGDAYKPIEEMAEILRLEVPSGELTSTFRFDEETGEINISLSNTDVRDLRTRFTSAGVTTIDLRAVAMQPGSSTHGPLIALANLPSADFSITVLG